MQKKKMCLSESIIKSGSIFSAIISSCVKLFKSPCIFVYRVRHLTFFFFLYILTLDSCLIKQIISFILLPNEYDCVYVWTTLGSWPAIDLRIMPILAKKIIFSDEAHSVLGGYVNKQNCRIWGTENPHTYIRLFW